jgi:hypothetical protein
MADRFDRNLLTKTSAIVGGILVAVILSWSVTFFRGYTLDDQAKSVGIAKDLLEIAAIIIGALWTIRTYLVGRTERQAVGIEQNIVHLRLHDGRYLLRVFVVLHNIGKVQVELRTWRLRADLLLPLSPLASALIAERSVFSERQAKWISLTDIDQGSFAGDDFLITLEPGESELQIGNLIVPKWTEVVQIYSHFQRNAGDLIEGWSQRSMIDLTKGDSDGKH